MKILLCTILVICIQTSLIAQVAISYMPWNSLIGISSSPENVVWADFKLQSNTFLGNMNMELSPMLTINRSKWMNIYFGPGISFNPAYLGTKLSVTNGYFINVGARIKAIEKQPKLHIVFELSPYVNQEFRGGLFRSRLGIGWNFGH